jgi:hypothetical protein
LLQKLRICGVCSTALFNGALGNWLTSTYASQNQATVKPSTRLFLRVLYDKSPAESDKAGRELSDPPQSKNLISQRVTFALPCRTSCRCRSRSTEAQLAPRAAARMMDINRDYRLYEVPADNRPQLPKSVQNIVVGTSWEEK